MPLILNRYSPDYRDEILTPLMRCIERGESACIVGPAGTGKSNLIHFLAQTTVKQRYLPADSAGRTYFVPLSCRPGSQSKDEIYNAMIQWVWEISKGIDQNLEGPSPYFDVLQQLRSALRLACHGFNARLVFLFDEFECLIQHQPPGFLEDLRLLRDDHRTTGNVVFVVFTHRLPHLVPGPTPLRTSKFFGIIRDNIYPLLPYRDADAQAMLEELIEKEGCLTLSATIRNRLIALSGGHPALLRSLFEALKPRFTPAAFTPASLLSYSQTQNACADIWGSLHSEEQEALRQIARGTIVAPDMGEFLCRRGLLVRSGSYAFFSDLFGEYIRRSQASS